MRGHTRRRGAGWALVVDMKDEQAQRCETCNARRWVEQERLAETCNCGGQLGEPQPERRQYWKSGFKTRKAAEEALRVFLSALDAGRDPLPKDLLVRDWVNQWLASDDIQGLRPHTVTRYSQVLTDYALPSLAKMRLDAVRPRHIRAVLEGVSAKGRSPRMRNEVRNILSSCFRRAVEDELIEVNPVTAVRSQTSRRKDQVTPNKEQLAAIVNEADGTTWERPITLAAFTGMRRSEVLGVRWSDIDIDAEGDRGRLTVNRGLHRVSGEKGQRSRLQYFDTKTETSRRTIDLGANLVAKLRRWKKDQAARRLRLGSAWVDADLVCDRGDGGPLDPDAFSKAFKRIASKAGVPDGVRLHDARHGVATAVLESGIDLKYASAMLGHSTTSFTRDAYSHVLEGMTAPAAKVLDDALGG